MSQTSPVTETLEFFYARDLLVSFVKEHCDPVPEWKPNGDLMGILMQFDNALTVVRSIKAGLDPKQSSGLAQTGQQPDTRALLQFVGWVDSWVSNPVGAYSVNALDGLFRLTRERIAALSDTSTDRTSK